MKTTPSSVEDMIGPYKRSKFEAEEVARELARERGLPVVIVNPSTPVGPGDIKPTPTGRLIVEAARGQMPAFVDTGLNIVHVDDVADGHLAAAEKGRIGERYILGGENMSLAEILAEVAQAVGRRPPRLRVPHAALFPVAFGAELAARRHRPRAVRDARRRSHVAQEDVFHLGKGVARARLHAAAGAPGHCRRGRLVPGQRLSAMTAVRDRLGVGSRAGSVETPSGKWRSAREFPGRIVSDPARPAAACPCLLPLCPKRRRHRRQPRTERRREDPRGSTAWRQSSTAPRARIRPPPRRCAKASRETGVTAQHCHDVLHAFRLDAVKLRYRDWDDLMAILPLFGLAGRPPAARPARREPRHLAGLRRAVLGAAGAQPPAGLRRRLPRCSIASTCRSTTLPRQGTGVEALAARRVEPGAAPRARQAARPHRRLIVDRPAACRRSSPRRGLRWECGVIVALAGAAAAPAAARRSVGEARQAAQIGFRRRLC